MVGWGRQRTERERETETETERGRERLLGLAEMGGGRFRHKLNSRAWANLTDLPIIAFRSPTEFCRLSFRAYADPWEIHCAVN